MCTGGWRVVLAGDQECAGRAGRRLLRQPPRILRRSGQPRQWHSPRRGRRHVRRRRRPTRQVCSSREFSWYYRRCPCFIWPKKLRVFRITQNNVTSTAPSTSSWAWRPWSAFPASYLSPSPPSFWWVATKSPEIMVLSFKLLHFSLF